MSALHEFLKFFLSVIKEGGYVEEQGFSTDAIGLFYKYVGKGSYIMGIAFWFIKINEQKFPETKCYISLGDLDQYLVYHCSD